MRRHRGFTLVEVVIAFLLLSVVLVIVFEIFTRGLSRAGELDSYSRALAIAQSQIADAGVEEALAEGDTRGESEDRQFQWVVSVRKYVDEAAPPPAQQPSNYGLYRVEARVGWRAAAGNDREVALSTLVLAAQSK
jgi:general secretion pathway protein I